MSCQGNAASRSSPAAASCTSFFERLYWSVGETLPHELKVHDAQEHRAIEPQREKLLQILVDSALESDLARSALQLGPSNLVRRFLPPGKFADMYTLYVSFQTASGLPVASPTTFYRVLRESGWRKVLRFRPTSTHTACYICSQLKARLKHATDIQSHTDATDLLMRHLAGQFQDRSVYWSLRTRAKRDLDILTVITDSMDRGKFVLPRYLEGKAPKDLAVLNRPSCELTACIIHGRLIYVALADEGSGAGTSWVLEVLNRALDLAYVQAQQKNLPWPDVLKVFADNTPKATWTFIFHLDP